MKTANQNVNRHGLKRSELSADIKREVRQRCGFGCVVCRSFIVQYHHFDPPFADAVAHRAEGITLLCGGCHDKVTRGVWSDEMIEKANDAALKHRPNAREEINLADPIYLVLGTMIFIGSGPLIRIGDDCLFEVCFKDDEARLNARFFDEDNKPTVIIQENELEFCADAWDVEAVGRRLVVRRGPHDVVFKAQLLPPHGIYVRSFNVRMHRWRIATNSKGQIRIVHESGSGLDFTADHASIYGGELGLADNGRFELRGGSGNIPYLASRFRDWIKEGSLDRLLWELRFQQILSVVPLRDTRKAPPPDAVTGRPLPDGLLRYGLYCGVCNEDRAGWRDLPPDKKPPERSEFMCQACAARPPDAWGVLADGKEVARFAKRSDAIAGGHRALKQSPSARLVIHNEGNGAPTIFFGKGKPSSVAFDPKELVFGDGSSGRIYIGAGEGPVTHSPEY